MALKTIPERINEMEATAKQCGVSVSSICEAARIDRTTWRHWKTGLAKPRNKNWRAACAAFAAAIEASDPGKTELRGQDEV